MKESGSLPHPSFCTAAHVRSGKERFSPEAWGRERTLGPEGLSLNPSSVINWGDSHGQVIPSYDAPQATIYQVRVATAHADEHLISATHRAKGLVGMIPFIFHRNALKLRSLCIPIFLMGKLRHRKVRELRNGGAKV